MKVFVHRTFSARDSTMAPQTPGQESTAQDGAQQCRTLNDVFERLEALRLHLRESKKSTNDVGQAEEPRDAFNRYDTLKKHDPPETMKQHQLKPWKSPPESPLDPSINTTPPKVTPKKPPREVKTMDKKELVDAMQWDHPTRTLYIGTINANATRALNGGIDQADAYTYFSAIKQSLRNVSSNYGQIQN
ncbi:hypothetical protein KI688_007763 [Linnemannia hyalina]|uniref:Uncharacterized protein n=1 Tax=Linnemannia hyalina TaxID=64524 RepID=A0A9P8BMJ2_9FUNG|nr:hypothetical protein KI688_007763 [Linnemannia hyalina]